MTIKAYTLEKSSKSTKKYNSDKRNKGNQKSRKKYVTTSLLFWHAQTKKQGNHSHKKDILTITKTKTAIPKAIPACREASEPLFEKRSDAAKVSETPYPTNGGGVNRQVDERGKLEQKRK